MASQRRSHGTCRMVGCSNSDNGHKSGLCPSCRHSTAVKSTSLGAVAMAKNSRGICKKCGKDFGSGPGLSSHYKESEKCRPDGWIPPEERTETKSGKGRRPKHLTAQQLADYYSIAELEAAAAIIKVREAEAEKRSKIDASLSKLSPEQLEAALKAVEKVAKAK